MSEPLVDITIPAVPPSLNEWYASSHWSARKKAKDQWKLLVKAATRGTDAVEDYPVLVDVTVAFGPGARRYDADNCVPAAKLVTDALEAIGVLEGDSCTYISEVRMRHARTEDDGYTRYKILPA